VPVPDRSGRVDAAILRPVHYSLPSRAAYAFWRGDAWPLYTFASGGHRWAKTSGRGDVLYASRFPACSVVASWIRHGGICAGGAARIHPHVSRYWHFMSIKRGWDYLSSGMVVAAAGAGMVASSFGVSLKTVDACVCVAAC